jgi:hypothetical protein
VSSWDTIIIVAGNQTLVDKIIKATKGTDAGQARILELPVGELPKDTRYEDGAEIQEALRGNYGHAGRVYSRFLVENHDAVAKQVQKLIGDLSTAAGLPMGERFRVGALAALLRGMQYAEHLGLATFPIDNIARWVMKYVTYEWAPESVAEQLTAGDQALLSLRQYLGANQARTYMATGIRHNGSTGPNYNVLVEPLNKYREPTVCLNAHYSCIITPSKVLSDYLADSDYSIDAFREALRKLGFTVTSTTKRFGRGIENLVAVPVSCTIISMETAKLQTKLYGPGGGQWFVDALAESTAQGVALAGVGAAGAAT